MGGEAMHRRALTVITWPIDWLGSSLLAFARSVRGFAHFVTEVCQWTFRRPFRGQLLFQHMEFIGNQSLNILLGSGLAVGGVFSLQIGGAFRVFKAESMVGGVTAKALCQELAPMVASILLTGRAGSAMTAEIATMRVNEQVDAMEAMAVDPISYLVVPRVLASMIVTPLMCSVFIFMGIIGAYFACALLFGIDEGMFLDKITRIVEVRDLERGLSKSVAFAGLMALVCCRAGLTASGGAKGVGVATTNAVVTTLLGILAVDLVITYFQIMW